MILMTINIQKVFLYMKIQSSSNEWNQQGSSRISTVFNFACLATTNKKKTGSREMRQSRIIICLGGMEKTEHTSTEDKETPGAGETK
jgi:hypothetical protein